MHHLARFALGGEDLRLHGQQIHGGDACFQLAHAHLKLRHALKHLQERLLIEAAKRFGRGVAEEDIARAYGRLVIRAAVHHHRHLFCQTLLQHTQMRSLIVRRYQPIDLLLLQRGEDLDVALGVVV